MGEILLLELIYRQRIYEEITIHALALVLISAVYFLISAIGYSNNIVRAEILSHNDVHKEHFTALLQGPFEKRFKVLSIIKQTGAMHTLLPYLILHM